MSKDEGEGGNLIWGGGMGELGMGGLSGGGSLPVEGSDSDVR
jgi:hypothetical protein